MHRSSIKKVINFVLHIFFLHFLLFSIHQTAPFKLLFLLFTSSHHRVASYHYVLHPLLKSFFKAFLFSILSRVHDTTFEIALHICHTTVMLLTWEASTEEKNCLIEFSTCWSVVEVSHRRGFWLFFSLSLLTSIF